MPTAHITLRMSRDLLTAVQNAAASQGMDRSKWIKDRLREGLALVPSPAPSLEGLDALQELVEVEIPAIREQLSALQDNAPVLDVILKLCIEAVMIGRQLALRQGEPVLHLAQTNARDYYNKVSGPAPKPPDRASLESPLRGQSTDS